MEASTAGHLNFSSLKHAAHIHTHAHTPKHTQAPASRVHTSTHTQKQPRFFPPTTHSPLPVAICTHLSLHPLCFYSGL